MKKVHIVRIGYQAYAFESIDAASKAIAFFGKLQKVRWNPNSDNPNDRGFYEPDSDEYTKRIDLESNQSYRDPAKPEQVKSLALPKPKRGTILCICEKSYVAPRTSCAHCGRPFSESHNRTHKSDAPSSNLRLL
ncbi:MAG: hypothetical protein QM680_00990 [Luteolibacter sp.]